MEGLRSNSIAKGGPSDGLLSVAAIGEGRANTGSRTPSGGMSRTAAARNLDRGSTGCPNQVCTFLTTE